MVWRCPRTFLWSTPSVINYGRTVETFKEDLIEAASELKEEQICLLSLQQIEDFFSWGSVIIVSDADDNYGKMIISIHMTFMWDCDHRLDSWTLLS